MATESDPTAAEAWCFGMQRSCVFSKRTQGGSILSWALPRRGGWHVSQQGKTQYIWVCVNRFAIPSCESSSYCPLLPTIWLNYLIQRWYLMILMIKLFDEIIWWYFMAISCETMLKWCDIWTGGGPRWSADGHELSFATNYLGLDYGTWMLKHTLFYGYGSIPIQSYTYNF